MIMPSDKDYKETKKIMKGKKKLRSPFRELSEWILKKYGTPVLNIYEDKMIPDNSPRLNVVFEYEKDSIKFHNGNSTLSGFDKIRQREVSEQYQSLKNELEKNNEIFTNGIFVTFSDFESVAKIEANESISTREVKKLKQEFANGDIWEISKAFAGATIFFYTEAQKKKYEKGDKRKEYSQKYLEILKKHDDFDYYKDKDFLVSFDTKENFDKNYNGSWFYYYR